MAERLIEVDGVELCTEAFGDPAAPPILLLMGLGGSMLWWEEGFCRLLADGGRFVLRYDQRDTGRSVTYEPGRPGYTGDDLVDDVARVLDGYGIAAAHLVGVSAGGGCAQLVALDHPERVLSLTLISTSPAIGRAGRELAPPATELMRFFSGPQPESRVEYLVDYCRVLAGRRRDFDEDAVRDLVTRDIERATSYSSVQNHDAIPDGERNRAPLSSISAPTLVIHGSADPMFPPSHGEALAAEIPGARLLLIDGMGHGVVRGDWRVIAEAIARHTG
jgi:pimeloyl-ACP methyl ester carboxylesterase